MNLMKKIWYIITYPFHRIKAEIHFRKKMKEIRKRVPFIYD